MRVVSPYRPFPPESLSHQALGAFDWITALRMLAVSVRVSCGCETLALTDVATPLPVPAFAYPSATSRLMLWILEVSLAYLDSPDFDQDTVFVSPDSLVLRDLRAYCDGDLTVLVRTSPKYRHRPMLNSIQWWPHAAKDRLVAFYRIAFETACQLPERFLVWGADTEALRQHLAPMALGVVPRAGLRVAMRESSEVLHSITDRMARGLQTGRIQRPAAAVLDFKGPQRKPWMSAAFKALFPGQRIA